MMNENHNITSSVSEISQPRPASHASLPVQPQSQMPVSSPGAGSGASDSPCRHSAPSCGYGSADSASSDHPSFPESRHDYGFLNSLIRRNPAAAHMIVDLISGEDPAESIHRHFPALAPDAEALRRAEQSGYDRGRRHGAEAAFSALSPGEEPVDAPDVSAAMRRASAIMDSLLSSASRSVWDD